jgi:predicted amidohydrolase
MMAPSSTHRQKQQQLVVCILQPPLRKPQETPLEATRTIIELGEKAIAAHCCSQKKIDLMLLPELCPVGYSEDTFANYLPSTPKLQKMYQQIDEQLQEAARNWNAAICYGTIGWQETSIDGGASSSTTLEYYIRQNVLDTSGTLIASYDKIHLCNYGDCAETRFFTPGQRTVSFSISDNDNDDNDWKLGLLICADMRYPNLSQTLVKDHGVDALLQPACFMRDISFRTWKSFRETRAVENGVYFLAGNYAGSNFGEASMVPPWVDEDHEPEVMGTEVGYLLATLDRQVLEHARTELPFYKHLCETKCCD